MRSKQFVKEDVWLGLDGFELTKFDGRGYAQVLGRYRSEEAVPSGQTPVKVSRGQTTLFRAGKEWMLVLDKNGNIVR